MPKLRKALLALPAVPLAAAGVVLAQVYYAAHRPDLPELENQDVSGTFGDPGLPRLRIVAIGDSSLTAPGIRDLDNTWIRQAARALSDRYRVELISLGIGGSRASDVLRDQVDPALALRPDIAVVAVGANDALRTFDLRRFEVTLHEMVAALHDHVSAVVLLGVGDLGTIPRLPKLLGRILSWRGLAADRVISRVVASYHRADRIEAWGNISRSFQSGDQSLWSPDLFHTSDEGNHVFLADTIPVFEDALRHLRRGT